MSSRIKMLVGEGMQVHLPYVGKVCMYVCVCTYNSTLYREVFRLLFFKHYNVQVTGLDIQEELVRISEERCVAMGMSDKVSPWCTQAPTCS